MERTALGAKKRLLEIGGQLQKSMPRMKIADTLSIEITEKNREQVAECLGIPSEQALSVQLVCEFFRKTYGANLNGATLTISISKFSTQHAKRFS